MGQVPTSVGIGAIDGVSAASPTLRVVYPCESGYDQTSVLLETWYALFLDSVYQPTRQAVHSTTDGLTKRKSQPRLMLAAPNQSSHTDVRSFHVVFPQEMTETAGRLLCPSERWERCAHACTRKIPAYGPSHLLIPLSRPRGRSTRVKIKCEFLRSESKQWPLLGTIKLPVPACAIYAMKQSRRITEGRSSTSLTRLIVVHCHTC